MAFTGKNHLPLARYQKRVSQANPQEVLMWNNFTKFCHGYDNMNDEYIQEEAKSLLNASLENQPAYS